ncbi:hypothetical protein VPH35_114150 [Triticum aestivum]
MIPPQPARRLHPEAPPAPPSPPHRLHDPPPPAPGAPHRTSTAPAAPPPGAPHQNLHRAPQAPNTCFTVGGPPHPLQLPFSPPLEKMFTAGSGARLAAANLKVLPLHVMTRAMERPTSTPTYSPPSLFHPRSSLRILRPRPLRLLHQRPIWPPRALPGTTTVDPAPMPSPDSCERP